MQSRLAGRRVLVTGGAGFIGSHAVDALLRAGAKVVVIDNLATGKMTNVPRDAEFHRVDIRDVDTLRRSVSGIQFDVVLHAAAEASVARSLENPDHSESVNVCGTRNVLEASCRPATRFVFLSSGGAVYGERKTCAGELDPLEPVSPYGVHKRDAEQVVRESASSHAILRLANVYGPRQRGDIEGGVVAIFFESLQSGRPVTIYGDGCAQRDLVHVEDVVRAIVSACLTDQCGTWNVGTGVARSVNEVLATIASSLAVRPMVRFKPAREGELAKACVDPAKARRDLEWVPLVTFRDGIDRLVSSGCAN